MTLQKTVRLWPTNCEYLRAGDALDAIITAKLDTEQLKKITDELYETIDIGADGDAESKVHKILDSACAQDLYERGVSKILYLDVASYDVYTVGLITCFSLCYSFSTSKHSL